MTVLTRSMLLSLSLFAVTASAAERRTLTLEVGEMKRFDIGAAQGVILDEPGLADLQLVGGSQVELVGRSTGTANLDVFSPSGARSTLVVQVKPDTAKRAPKKVSSGNVDTSGSIYSDSWDAPRFGGTRLEKARCALPFRVAGNARRFQQAQALLRRDELAPAIRKLEEITQQEPEAATPYLFLGAALAKQDDAKGAAAFETFALSCADDPRSPAVARMLRQLGRSGAKK